jgi:hypothetical protein
MKNIQVLATAAGTISPPHQIEMIAPSQINFNTLRTRQRTQGCTP